MWRGGLGAGLRWVRCELGFLFCFCDFGFGGRWEVGEMGEMMANVGSFGGR